MDISHIERICESSPRHFTEDTEVTFEAHKYVITISGFSVSLPVAFLYFLAGQKSIFAPFFGEEVLSVCHMKLIT
jgi:hypothetical protein